MIAYKIIQESLKGNFSLLAANSGQKIVDVEVKGYTTQSANFQLFDNLYEIKLKNIWSSKRLIIRNGLIIGEIKMNWKGHISIIFNEFANNRNFLMKQRGLINYRFEVFDDTNINIIELKQTTKLLKFHFDINILHNTMNERELLELLTITGYTCLIFNFNGAKM